ncbi:MAG: YdcF family protein [Pseudomonadota bacterium]
MQRLLEALILPPGSGLALLVVALLAGRTRWRRIALPAAIAGALLIYLPATPWVAGGLMQAAQGPVAEADPAPAGAILLPGAGRAPTPPGADHPARPSALARDRLLRTARLARATGRPVITSGGDIDGLGEPEAETLARELVELGVPVRWREGRARNSRENARRSAALLREAGIERVWVVTHAWHMPRLVDSFAGTGVDPVPVEVGRVPAISPTPAALLPDAGALARSSLALHELAGRLWYHLRYD